MAKSLERLDLETKRSFKKLFYNYAFNARKKHRPWQLSESAFYTLTQSPCHYCGEPPRCIYTRRKSNRKGPFRYNGIDRLNSKKGYTDRNVVPCCGTCNFLKGRLKPQEFLAHIGKIACHFLSSKKTWTMGRIP